MEFDTTRGACPWNSDQNCTQNLAMLGGGLGVVGVRDEGSLGVGGSGGSRGESNLTMFTSNEYEEEYGLFLYNATWILDNQPNFVHSNFLFWKVVWLKIK